MTRPVAYTPSIQGLPDWRLAAAYRDLVVADRSIFAWEWLRRTEAYRRAWENRAVDAGGSSTFGLERFEDPLLAMPAARPMWRAAIDPTVIIAKVQRLVAPPQDRVDLLDWSHLVTIAIDQQQVEHLLFSDGAHALRIDVLEGTLIGCPAELRYRLDGLHALHGPLFAIRRLMHLCDTGKLYTAPSRLNRLPLRWVLELRAADALISGADQQEIARALYGGLVADERWRSLNGAYRTRVQRLVRTARQRLARPLDKGWFAAGP